MSAAAGQLQDGLGQSVWTELVWAWRFRKLRRQSVAWLAPSEADHAAWRADGTVEPFGDHLVAVARIDGRRAWILENDWFGWPDPPQYAFFAFDAEGAIWAATNFNHWPERWTLPES